MKQCEDYNEINLYNTLVKKINEIIDELNKVDLQKLEMQRLLNTAYEIKNDLNKIQMECNQVLDNIDNKLKDVKDSVKLIKLLNIENKTNRLVAELEGNNFTLTGSKNGILEIESIQGNTLWVDNETGEVLTEFDNTKNLRLQSSFEDKQVTEGENVGKYACQVKVVGKNLFDKSQAPSETSSGMINVKPNTTYYFYGENPMPNGAYAWLFEYDLNDKQVSSRTFWGYDPFTTNQSTAKIKIESSVPIVDRIVLALTEVTEYEPYKVFTKTIYLNSPLLEGDTIEDNGNNVVHVHRYGKVVLDGVNYIPVASSTNIADKKRWSIYKDKSVKNLDNSSIIATKNNKYCDINAENTWSCSLDGIAQNTTGNILFLYLEKYSDGSENSKQALINELQSNPLIVVYELASPTIEIIGENNIDIMECFEGCSIDYDTVIPVGKTKVVYTGKEKITTYAIEDDILLNDSGIELNSNDEEVF